MYSKDLLKLTCMAPQVEILPIPGSITTSLIVEAWASCLEAHQNRGIPIGRYEVFVLATTGPYVTPESQQNAICPLPTSIQKSLINTYQRN